MEGFKFGNSPLSYVDNPNIIGKKLVLTTTNGTKAINSSLESDEILIGSFLNLSSLESLLLEKNKGREYEMAARLYSKYNLPVPKQLLPHFHDVFDSERKGSCCKKMFKFKTF